MSGQKHLQKLLASKERLTCNRLRRHPLFWLGKIFRVDLRIPIATGVTCFLAAMVALITQEPKYGFGIGMVGFMLILLTLLLSLAFQFEPHQKLGVKWDEDETLSKTRPTVVLKVMELAEKNIELLGQAHYQQLKQAVSFDLPKGWWDKVYETVDAIKRESEQAIVNEKEQQAKVLLQKKYSSSLALEKITNSKNHFLSMDKIASQNYQTVKPGLKQ